MDLVNEYFFVHWWLATVAVYLLQLCIPVQQLQSVLMLQLSCTVEVLSNALYKIILSVSHPSFSIYPVGKTI